MIKHSTIDVETLEVAELIKQRDFTALSESCESTIGHILNNSKTELLDCHIVIAGTCDCVSRQMFAVEKSIILTYLANALLDEAIAQGNSKDTIMDNIEDFIDTKLARIASEKEKAE